MDVDGMMTWAYLNIVLCDHNFPSLRSTLGSCGPFVWRGWKYKLYIKTGHFIGVVKNDMFTKCFIVFSQLIFVIIMCLGSFSVCTSWLMMSFQTNVMNLCVWNKMMYVCSCLAARNIFILCLMCLFVRNACAVHALGKNRLPFAGCMFTHVNGTYYYAFTFTCIYDRCMNVSLIHALRFTCLFSAKDEYVVPTLQSCGTVLRFRGIALQLSTAQKGRRLRYLHKLETLASFYPKSPSVVAARPGLPKWCCCGGLFLVKCLLWVVWFCRVCCFIHQVVNCYFLLVVFFFGVAVNAVCVCSCHPASW